MKQDAKGFANAVVIPDGSVKKECGSGGGGAGISSGAEVVEGLQEVVAAAKQEDKYGAALAWCKAQGVTTVEMLQEAPFGDELAAHLGLQPIPAAFLLRKIREWAGSEPAEGSNAAGKRPAHAEPEGDNPSSRQRS